MESLLQKIVTCHRNPEKSPPTKIIVLAACGYSLFTHFSFDTTKYKLDCYRSKDCMKNFCEDLKKHAPKIINSEKKRNDTINL